MSEEMKCSVCGSKLLRHFGDLYSCPKCSPKTGFKLESVTDLLDEAPFIIKIVEKKRGIEVQITTHEPNDVIMIAGQVNFVLRSVGYEPDVVILP